MKIKNLTALKDNETFKLLNQKQSQYDDKDYNMRNDRFTRSPLHALQFLITYAGLDKIQRSQVATKLNAHLGVQHLDKLINDIDWVSILNTPKESSLQFQFTIAIANKTRFFAELRMRCPQLHEALINSKTSIVKIEQNDQVKFTTKVAQNELWSRPFIRETGDDFWKVPDFHLSDKLQTLLDRLEEGEQRTIGGFTLKKGRGELANQTELHITAPYNKNQYSVESHIETNTGIYNAFVGLENFYGLARVDYVTVEMDSNAEFSDKGASASQTQVNTCVEESFILRTSTPTIVKVNELHVYFEGADIVANFTNDTDKTDEYFDLQFSVQLPTKSKENTQVSLLAYAPNPEAAFKLTTQGPKPKSAPLLVNNEDLVSESETTTDYSFYLKCLAGFAMVAGGVVMIVGLAMTNPLLMGLGVTTLITGGYSLFGLFANTAKNSSARNDQPYYGMMAI